MDRQNNIVGQSEKPKEEPATRLLVSRFSHQLGRKNPRLGRPTFSRVTLKGTQPFIATIPDDLTWRLRPANTEISRAVRAIGNL